MSSGQEQAHLICSYQSHHRWDGAISDSDNVKTMARPTVDLKIHDISLHSVQQVINLNKHYSGFCLKTGVLSSHPQQLYEFEIRIPY